MEKLSVQSNINKKRITRDDISKFLFFSAFLLLVFVDYVSATSIPHLFTGRIFQTVILILGIKILATHYTKIEWIIIGIGAILAVISFMRTDSYFVCILIMLIMASKDVSLKPVMRIYFIVVSCITVLVAILAVTGVCGEMFMEQDFRGNGLEIRYCMGYTHPNTFHIVLIQLLLAGIWLFWDKLKWYHFIVCGGINILVNYYTDSRTNLILGSLILIACILLKLIPALRKWIGIYFAGITVLIISIFLSVSASVYGTSIPIFDKLNQIWTNRILMSYLDRNNFRLTPFSYLECHASCDMGYVNIAYNYGWVIILIIIALFCGLIWKVTERKDYIALVGIVTGLILFLGEQFSSGEYITRNLIFVYMLGWGMYESDKNEKVDMHK